MLAVQVYKAIENQYYISATPLQLPADVHSRNNIEDVLFFRGNTLPIPGDRDLLQIILSSVQHDKAPFSAALRRKRKAIFPNCLLFDLSETPS